MIIANDPDPGTPVMAPEERTGVSPGYPGKRDEHAPGIPIVTDAKQAEISPYVGTRSERRTYANSGQRRQPVRPVEAVRVTDDFGERIEVRIGEALILGPLIDAVLEELRAKRANEG